MVIVALTHATTALLKPNKERLLTKNTCPRTCSDVLYIYTDLLTDFGKTMLQQLTISNYAIAEQLDIELSPGMTVLTGETGAGKSIMLDALGLALGDRADANIVRHGAPRTDIVASFDISNIPPAQQWLKQRDLDDAGDCLLRRTISAEGRSRAFINGQPAPLGDVKALGALLVDIHSQHAHQSLLKKEHQRNLLDAFAKAGDLASEVKQLAKSHQQKHTELEQRRANQSEGSARSQLLRYQLDELEALNITVSEIEDLALQQKQLANAEDILSASHHALALCRESEVNATGVIRQALSALKALKVHSAQQLTAIELLDSAVIQVEEASSELQHHIDDTEIDPVKLAEIEQRLDVIYELARKHKVRPEELPAHQQAIADELESLDCSDEAIEALETELKAITEQYQLAAASLSNKRQTAAKKLKKAVEGQLTALSMANCRFEPSLTPHAKSEVHRHGAEDVEFLLSTNPGTPAGALNKIASGGELSRISLAIQVVTAQVEAVPTVIFDEVDVGIGGATAEIVGELLHTLGKRSQVLCVTHQAQVASKGDQHIKVIKQTSKKSVKTSLEKLDETGKVAEIARMMGGVAITESTLAHAEEMLGTRH